MYKLKKTVFICGFMGSGKSTVGKLLSQKLKTPRVDTDFIISKTENKSPVEIFATMGELYFRKKETKLLRALGKQSPRVISLGGGSIISPENAGIIKQSGAVVFLDVPFETVYERVKRNNRRPVANNMTEEELRALYERRLSIYRSVADIEVKGCRNPHDTAKRIIEELIKNGILEEN